MALKVSVFLVVFVLMLGIALGFYRTLGPSSPSMSQTSITGVTIGTTTIPVEVVATPQTREEGLSGRSGLPKDSGMLFVFDAPGNYGFWMKDMLFSIDMVFIDANGIVVTVDGDLSPESYHQSPPQVYYPLLPASYVLELPAGFAKAHNIVEGSQTTFETK